MSGRCGSDSSQHEGPLRDRTRQFAIRVIKLVRAINDRQIGNVIGNQVLRSGTSVGAQYREACRARSTAEFASKVKSAAQELEETMYWFELLIASEVVPPRMMSELEQEADEILRMLLASERTARGRKPTENA
ncbi:MAG: four helix bundle protein [Planctomycetota bacterium]